MTLKSLYKMKKTIQNMIDERIRKINDRNKIINEHIFFKAHEHVEDLYITVSKINNEENICTFSYDGIIKKTEQFEKLSLKDKEAILNQRDEICNDIISFDIIENLTDIKIERIEKILKNNNPNQMKELILILMEDRKKDKEKIEILERTLVEEF